MKLIEDLGTRNIGNKGHKARYGLYECPVCHKHFECRVASVKSGHTTKCRSCANKIPATKAASEFIEKAIDVHGELYKYLLVVYINSRTKVKITCKIHGTFEQTPNKHLQGCGCPHCAKSTRDKAMAAKAASEFVEKAVSVHGDLYGYTLVDYMNTITKVKITCKIHGVFEQTPNSHLNGQGCPECAKERRNIAMRMSEKNDRPTTLYYIYFPEVNLWKIGCTTRPLAKRFSRESLKYEVLGTKEYTSGNEAYRVEKFILDATKTNQFTGKVLKEGNTELRTQPIEDFGFILQEAELLVTP